MSKSNAQSETTAQPDQQRAPAAEANREETFSAASFRKLLSEDPGESQTEDESESESSSEPDKSKAGKPKGKPKAFKELAERLELTPEDLYAVEVPMADGRTMTLGKLKDAGAIQDQLTVREMQFAERVGKQEADWTRQQAEFSQLVSMIDPKALTPEMKKRAADAVTENNKRERAEVMRLIPEWANQELRESELEGMVKLLGDYGIGESFLTANMSSKLMRFVRDAFLRKARIERALASVTVVKKEPSKTGKSGAAGKPPRSPNRAPMRPTGRGGLQEQFRKTLEQG